MSNNYIFRGKRVDNGEWVFGCIVNNLWVKTATGVPVVEIITGPGDNCSWDDIAEDDQCLVEVLPETVGMWTGLTDKAGQKIFEGDVCRYFNSLDGAGVCEIQFEAGFVAHWKSGKIAQTNMITPLYYMQCSQEIEVAGSIHDTNQPIK